MHIEKIIRLNLFICTLLVLSCSDEESHPEMKFSAGTEIYSLESTKLFLLHENTWKNRTYRIYVISDGDYTNATGHNGWGLSDYEGASFFLRIDLSSTVNGQLNSGEYPQFGDWPAAQDDSKISWVYMHSAINGNFSITTPEGNTIDRSPVIVKGGFEDGNKMTLEFEGPLDFDDNNSIEPTQCVLGKIYFSGKVHDRRDI